MDAKLILSGPASWDRFRLYAGFVKSAGITILSTVLTRSSLTEFMYHHWPTSILFPNLRSLRFFGFRTTAPFVDLPRIFQSLASPSLQNLQIRLRDAEHKSAVLAAFFHTVEHSISDLQSLSLDIKWISNDPADLSATCGCLTTALRAHANIHTLTLDLPQVYIPYTFSVASDMRRLRNFSLRMGTLRHISVTDLVPTPDNTIASNSFPALVKLHAKLQASALAFFLSHVPLDSIEDITLHLGEEEGFLLTQGLSPMEQLLNLTSLGLECDGRWGQRWDLEPLLRCSKLETVKLTFYTDLMVSDGMLDRMAKAWRRLRRLEIVDNGETIGGTDITCRGAESLAQHCPDLQSLSLTINFSQISKGDVERVAGHSLAASSVNHLDLQYSPGVRDDQPESEDAIALYISTLWPNLMRGTTVWCSDPYGFGSEGNSEEEFWDEIWEKVGIYLGRSVTWDEDDDGD